MTDYVIRIVVNGQDNASAPLGRVGSALGSMAQIAGGILGAQMFQAIGRGIADMGREALDATASWERMGLAMQSMIAREMVNTGEMGNLTQAMSAAGPKAEELLGWLERLAINSPFDAEGVAQTYRQALTFGFASDKAKELTQILIDMSAGMGLTGYEMERVGYALGQINSSDKLLMQDLRQLMNVGVPVNDILKTMGYDLSDVGKKAISSKDFIAAFNKEMGEGFSGAAAKQAKSWAGLLNSISDIKKIDLREFFSSTFDAIQPLIAKFVDKFSDPAFTESLRKWGEPLGKIVGQVTNLALLFSKIKAPDLTKFDLSKMLQDIKNADLETIFERINQALVRKSGEEGNAQMRGRGYTDEEASPALKAIKKALDDFRNSDAFDNILAASKNFSKFWDENGEKIIKTVTDLGQRLSDAFGPTISDIVTFLSEKFLLLSEWFDENGPLISDYLSVMGELFALLGEAVAGAWGVIEPILSGLFNHMLLLSTLVMQVVTGDWAGAWETMGKIVDNFFETYKNVFTGSWEWIAGIMGTSLAEIGATWAANWEQFKFIIVQVWDIIVAWVTTKLNEMWMAILTEIYGMYVTWTNNWNQFVAIISAVWAIIVSWISGKLGEIRANLTGFVANISSQWTMAWENFKAIVGGAWAYIKAAIEAKFADVIAAIRNKITQFIQAGRDIVKGLEQGIKDAWAGLMATVQGLVNKLVSTVQGALDINSPSKVFAKIGAGIMEGWAMGMTANANMPISSALATSNAISGTAAGTVRSTVINATINNPAQSERAVRDDIRLLQLAVGA